MTNDGRILHAGYAVRRRQLVIVAMQLTKLWLVVSFTWVAVATADERLLADISSMRLAGELAGAQALCERALEDPRSSRDTIRLHLELSRIHDRYGLHNNTRPVGDALRHVELAESLVEPGDDLSTARVELAFADYHYRAEMPDREFATATHHAERAQDMFTAMADWHGAAEAVHKLGLIRMQQGRYDEARELFDESLALDIKGGPRTFFLGEYERHVGFVDRFTGNMESAVPHFERSLHARREAGAIDASLFAAVSLGSTLIETGRAAEAGQHLRYALEVASDIGSGYGEAIALLALGQYHRELGEADQAKDAFERTAEAARSIGNESIERRAYEALGAL